MSDFLDEVMSDCTEAETDLGAETMVWDGFTYPVAGTTLKHGATIVVGGKEVEIRLTIRVRWKGTNSAGAEWEFTAASHPKQGDRVYTRGKYYRIASANNSHDTFMELELMDVNR